MAYSYKQTGEFPSSFKVTTTGPFDTRTVLDSVDDLTDGTIDYPYVGMVVSIKGTANLYVLVEYDDQTKTYEWEEIKCANEIKDDTDKISDEIIKLTEKQTNDKKELSDLIDKTKNDILGGEGLKDTFDTLKEIQDWAENHGSDYTDLVKSVSDLETKHDEDKAELDKSISDLETKHDEDKAELDKSISDLETKHDEDIKTITDTHNADKTALEEDIEESKLYDSEAKSSWETVEVGGIAAGTNPSAFEGKTISEVLDSILYPTLQPNIETEPSVKLTYNNNSTSGAQIIITVGDIIPLEDSFGKVDDRGKVSYTNAAGNTFYAGAAHGQTLTVNSGGALGGVTTENTYTVTYSATFAAGPKLLDNKGGESTVASYPGGTKTATKVFIAVYPIYINSSKIDTVTEYTKKNYLASTGVTLTDINIPAETYDNKFELHIPEGVKITSVKQFNTIANAYNLTINMVKVGTTTHNGKSYDRYVRTTDSGSRQGASKYQIIIKK